MWQFAGQILHAIDNATELAGVEQLQAIPPSTWMFFKMLARGFSSIDRISLVRTGRVSVVARGMTSERESLIVSLFGGLLQATNPKDHVYALLGLSDIDVKPHYSDDVPVRRVYRDFVAGWLRKYHLELSRVGRLDELDLLKYAGIGMFDNPFQLPSWAPNFPAFSRNVNSVGPKFAQSQRFEILFPRPEAPAAVIQYHLRCEGLPFDKITLVSEPCMTALDNGSFIEMLKAFIKRHPMYVSGIHPILAFLRALTQSNEHKMHGTFRMQATRLIGFLLRGIEKNKNVTPADLGLPANAKSLSCTFILNHVSHQYQEAPSTEAIQPDANTTTGTDVPSHTFEDTESDYHLDLDEKLEKCRVFVTSRGYLGLTLYRTQPGDVVYILKGCDYPVVLREVGDNLYSLVNVCFVVGIEHGQAIRYLEEKSHLIRALYLE
jgi:hypothetical protein